MGGFMKIAAMTIVKNEEYYLPVWLNYYRQFFSPKDIFVMDNGTDDGSTMNIHANVIKVISEFSFDCQRLVDMVKAMQRQLLEIYDAVLFAEADEILVPKEHGRFDQHIKKFKVVRCNGFEVVHVMGKEPSLDWSRSILQQRGFWFHNPEYCKPLLSKVPLDWEHGFHNCNPEPPIDPNFVLIHLRRIDYEHSKMRLLERARWPRPPDQPVNKAHQWALPANEFERWFRLPFPHLMPIPKEIRNVC